MNQKIVSREYKSMLKKELFIGTEDKLLEQAERFWSDFKNSIKNNVLLVTLTQ